MTTFMHTPLANPHHQIRLLRFLPGSGDQLLELKIAQHYIYDTPEYDAISYTWGDASHRRVVKINDSELAVRHSCYYALWQARTDSKARWIWIDSVCINQDDLIEKSTQVGIMGKIYGKAATVLACIGAHADDSDVVFSMTPEDDDSWFSMNASQLMMQMETRTDWADLLTPGKQLVRLFRAFYALQDRPYWRRLWILQEIALGKSVNVLCGEGSMSWSRLRGLARIAVMYDLSESLQNVCPDLPRSEDHVVQDISYLVQSGANSQSLSALIREACGRECFDDRDRIYSITALVDWSCHKLPAIIPDYTKSAIELAFEVAKFLDFMNLTSVLKALVIRFDCTGLAPLLQERRQAMSAHTTFSDGIHEPFRISYEAENKLRICEIVMDEHNNLTTALKLKTNRFDHGDNATIEIMQRLSEVIESELGTLGPQAIMVGSDIAAITCRDTRAGDVLVPLNYIDSPGILFLVLRNNHDDIYDIVGQAVSLAQYIMCDVTKPQSLYCDCADGLRHDNIKASVALQMSKEDALILLAQDYVDEMTFDPVARLRRLTTRACLMPCGAARLSNLESWTKFDDDENFRVPTIKALRL